MTSHRRNYQRRHHRLEIRVRFAPLPPQDVVVINGLRVTSITRTLIDLAGDLARDEAIRLTRQAIDRGLVSLDELRRAADERTDLESIGDFREVLHSLDSNS